MNRLNYIVLRKVTFEEAKYICENICKIKGNYECLYPCEKEDLIEDVTLVIKGENPISELDFWTYSYFMSDINQFIKLFNFLLKSEIIKLY